jgi:predicted PurR-regulated permease PerM
MEPEVRRRSAWIAFGVLLVAAVVMATWVALPLWKPLLLAAVLATATYGPYRRLSAKLGGRRHVAAWLMTALVIVAVLIPIAIIATMAIREAISVYDDVASALREGGMNELVSRLPDRVEGPIRRLLAALPVAPTELPEQAAGGATGIARIIGDVVAGLGAVVFSLVMMLIAYFAMLTDGKRFLDWIEDVSPLRGRQTIELLSELRAVSRSVQRSTVVTAAAQSVVASIGYAIAGVSNVVFFGLLTFFSAFIPSIGTGIVAIPIALVLLLLGQTWQGIFLFAWGALVVGLVDNLLKPILIRNGMHLHGVIVFFSLVGGVLVFGAIGLILGPLAITFLLTMIRFGYRDFSPRKKPGEAEDIPAPAKAEQIPAEHGPAEHGPAEHVPERAPA